MTKPSYPPGTLIEPSEVNPDRDLILDCRYDLLAPDACRTWYEEGHLPRAHLAHLDEVLSRPPTPPLGGRHPLPEEATFGTFLGAVGYTGQRIVCYDQDVGMWASRAWWLLRHAGITDVVVLQGGYSRWVREGHPTSKEAPARGTKQVPISFGSMPAATLEQARTHQRLRRPILDARAPARFQGETEPIDPVAGHVPGATNVPFANLVAHGQLDPQRIVEELRATTDTLVMCGSGVTACHLVLASAATNQPLPTLYLGSWSEWCQPSLGNPVWTPEG